MNGRGLRRDVDRLRETAGIPSAAERLRELRQVCLELAADPQTAADGDERFYRSLAADCEAAAAAGPRQAGALLGEIRKLMEAGKDGWQGWP